ncbi:MAG: hypothetical protein D6744_10115 [Planctomycetota bacterium]|nr:MAG: hypothetical protein D6744_10115 [Planctomycetota bacterium]
MGFTAFKTPESLFLVRGSERIEVGLGSGNRDFATIAWRASGLTPASATHRSYLTVAIYFIAQDARAVEDVSWSFVDENKCVFFPQGDAEGRLLHITPDGVKRTRMSQAKVPAVAGVEFEPFEYVEQDGGIDQVSNAFRWTSLPPDERMVLVHWLVALPLLRRIGTIPIMRIEGGSGSGKTRTVDAVSWLVNGRDCSSVPTAAALASRLAREMLTIDDNRESTDVTPAMLGTLLQATQLGARSKRKINSDTGTVVERVAGALLMNGVEPIHNGKSELASRMLTIRCSRDYMSVDSPRSESELHNALLAARDSFWSEAARRCAAVMRMDKLHGGRFSAAIEEAFGATRIGRMSVYLRAMVFAWIAGKPESEQQDLLDAGLPPCWRAVFGKLSESAMSSLVAEELAVVAVEYAFAFARSVAEAESQYGSVAVAVDGKYQHDLDKGDEALGEIGARQLARLAREAGKQLNAPWAVTHALRAGQLEQRILDGQEFLRAAGYEVEARRANSGRWRFTFYRHGEGGQAVAPPA